MALKIVTLIIGASFVVACEDIGSEATYVAKPVVEGYLYVGHPVQIKIYLESLNNESGVSLPVEDADVIIVENETDTFSLTNSEGGIYESDELIVKENHHYAISFEYRQKAITANIVTPAKPGNYKASAKAIEIAGFSSGNFNSLPQMPEPVDLSWNNENGEYHLVVAENIESAPSAINEGFDDEDRPRFRNEPNTNNSYEIAPFSFTHYGRHHIILFRINAEYASLYKNSGNSSQNLASPYSNINNGLGIFTGINSDTLELQVKKP